MEIESAVSPDDNLAIKPAKQRLWFTTRPAVRGPPRNPPVCQRWLDIACCLRSGAPPAIALAVPRDGQIEMPVNRTMFIRGFGLIVRGTAASFGDGIAIDLLEEWRAAVRYAAIYHAHRAGFADARSLSPVGRGRGQTHLPKTRRSRLRHRPGDRPKRVGCATEAGHESLIGLVFRSACEKIRLEIARLELEGYGTRRKPTAPPGFPPRRGWFSGRCRLTISGISFFKFCLHPQ